MSRRVLLYSFLVLSAGGCLFVPDGRCGPESREVILVAAPSPVVDHGQLWVVERDAAPARTLGWFVESKQLWGRVENAALVERGTGRQVMTLPVSIGPDSIALQYSAIPYSGTLAFDRFFDLARSEQIVMTLDTSTTAAPRVELAFTLFRYQPWSQPYCS